MCVDYNQKMAQKSVVHKRETRTTNHSRRWTGFSLSLRGLSFFWSQRWSSTSTRCGEELNSLTCARWGRRSWTNYKSLELPQSSSCRWMWGRLEVRLREYIQDKLSSQKRHSCTAWLAPSSASPAFKIATRSHYKGESSIARATNSCDSKIMITSYWRYSIRRRFLHPIRLQVWRWLAT